MLFMIVVGNVLIIKNVGMKLQQRIHVSVRHIGAHKFTPAVHRPLKLSENIPHHMCNSLSPF